MQLFDTLALGDTRVTADGYLIADVRAARVGIQVYAGREVGKPELASVRVYRPESEVFKDATMASFTHNPVTLDHPPEMVGPGNWKKYAVGFTAESVARDGGFIRVPLAVKRELSCGYTCDVVFEPGTTPEGQAYDAIQTNIVANHLAIVDAGRAGPDCRIGDHLASQHEGGRHMTDKLKTVIVDGIPIEVTDQGATVIETLQRRLSDAEVSAKDKKTKHVAAMDAMTVSHTAALALKDKELGEKAGEIEKLKTNQLDASKLDTLVAERTEVVTRAKSIADKLDFTGKSNTEIRRLSVAAKLGDEKVKDRSDDYVHALFDSLVTAAPSKAANGVRDAFTNVPRHSNQNTNDAEAAYDAYVANLTTGWQSQNQKEAV